MENHLETITSEIDFLIESIENISFLHKNHSEQWIERYPGSPNLRKKQINNICHYTKLGIGESIEFDPIYLTSLNKYCSDLNFIVTSPYYDFIDWKLEHRFRIKDPISRLAKIMHYVTNKEEEGKVRINKCFNDLLGFRIWMQDFEHTEANYEYIRDRLKSSRIKIHNSSKGEYIATHVYFSNGDNRCYPWELQIWNHLDDKKNTYSHSIYKQEYTKWVGVFKDAEFTKGG